MNGIGHAMTAAAERLLSALPAGGRRHACYPFRRPGDDFGAGLLPGHLAAERP